MYQPQNDGYMEINIGQPVLVKQNLGDYHEYPVTGRDSLGAIECMRRFSHFIDFHRALCERFPGLYIPPIPPKAQDKKGSATLEERHYFLDLFCKECISLPYLVTSPEMQTFIRPIGDVDKALAKYLRPKPEELLITYRATLKLPEVNLWLELTLYRTIRKARSETSTKESSSS